jgi:hypothetical protein
MPRHTALPHSACYQVVKRTPYGDPSSNPFIFKYKKLNFGMSCYLPSGYVPRGSSLAKASFEDCGVFSIGFSFLARLTYGEVNSGVCQSCSPPKLTLTFLFYGFRI